jgi:hypothetical protein
MRRAGDRGALRRVKVLVLVVFIGTQIVSFSGLQNVLRHTHQCSDP